MRQQLVSQLKCPVNWEAICPIEEFRYLLKYYWTLVVREHEVDLESSLFDYDTWEPQEDWIGWPSNDEVKAILINIATWKAKAERQYKDFCKRFTELRAAGPDDYDKHYTCSNASDSEVAELSIKRGESVLYPRITLPFQSKLMWGALVNLFLEKHSDVYYACFNDPDIVANDFLSIFGNRQLKIFVYTGVPIGCSGGFETKFARLDFDFSTSLMHIYPDTEIAFNNATYKTNVTMTSS